MSERTVNLDGDGVFPTITGVAGNLPVHWYGDETMATDHERMYENSSPLNQFLIRNAYTVEGLSTTEIREAENLIKTLPEGTEICWMRCEKHVIADTGMCRGHCMHALAMRV